MTQHFVAYHNIDQRGSPLDRAHSGTFETSKAKLPQVGDVLWCFEGEGRRPREYRLVKRAEVARSERSITGPSLIRYQGADQLEFMVNEEPWFKRFFVKQGRFGFGVQPILDSPTIAELESLAAGIRADAVEADVTAIERDRSLPATTRKALIDARRGQGTFRRKLDEHWGHACAVTKCTVRAVLRASHIKSWSHSTNKERLDPANGILLSANIDTLFDRGLVSFDDGGNMLTSSRLSATEKHVLGVPANLRRKPDARQQSYLVQHGKKFGF